MGRRGPPRTPTAVLAQRGSWLAKTRPNEPRPAVESPDRPDWLNDEAAAVWDQVVPFLLEIGVLSRVDSNALARYCVGVVRFQRLFNHPNAQVTAVSKLAAQLLRLEKQFGMTPSARQSIQGPRT